MNRIVFWPILGTQLTAGWADLMLHALYHGILAMLLVWGIIRLFPRIHPTIQCWLWRLAYLKLLIALFWRKQVPLYLHFQTGLRQLGWTLANSHAATYLSKIKQSLFKTDLTIPAPYGSPTFWFILWLAGLFFFLTGLFYLWRRQYRRSGRYFPILDPIILSRYQELGHRNKFRNMPRLFAAERLKSPLLQGIFAPRIILPASMVREFSADELELILAHELAHYQRGDLIWNWLPLIAHSLFFFLPFIWLIEQKLLQLQEICCDRLALQFTHAPAACFGNVLLRVSLRPGLQKSGNLAVYYESHSFKTLQNRLRALHSVDHPKRKQRAAAGCCLLLLGIVAVIPWRLALAKILPVNLWISYYTEEKFAIYAYVRLPERRVKATTVLIDDKQLYTIYNLNNRFYGYAKAAEEHFPSVGPHKVTVKAITGNGVITEQNWIYFQNSMRWSNQNTSLQNDQTVIKIGPFFWIIPNS
jgi:beta-lactamase regulating signal transducer with metallopeptidase domain